MNNPTTGEPDEPTLDDQITVVEGEAAVAASHRDRRRARVLRAAALTLRRVQDAENAAPWLRELRNARPR